MQTTMSEDNSVEISVNDEVPVEAVPVDAEGNSVEEGVVEAELAGDAVLPEDEPVAGDEPEAPPLSIGAE